MISEQTVHVETKASDSGVMSADHDRIRSALYDLSSKETKTHTVVLPHGTKIQNSTPMGRSLALYRPHFTIGNDGQEKLAVGVESAANLARTVDTLAMPTDEKQRFAQMREGEPVSEAFMAKCPSCGHDMPKTLSKCRDCGAKLSESATTGSTPSSPAISWSGSLFSR